MKTPITKNGWTLVHKDTKAPIMEGETIPDFRDEPLTINGGEPPHKRGSTGRIWTDQGQFYPGVCNLRWIIVKP